MERTNNTIFWVLFGMTFLVYSICLPSSITFWDSPEFIASNYKLQITHPAGAPFYTLLCNVLTGVFYFLKPALVSNLISAFFGALTVSFVYKIIVQISSSLLHEKELKWLHIISGCIGALSLAFSTSFWTASTEAEVYTLSFFLLTFIVWLGIKWHNSTSKKTAIKLLSYISLLLGISVGVHLINIAVVIPLSLLFVHKKYRFSFKNSLIGVVSGVILFFFLLNFVFYGIVKLCASIDIWTTNSLHLNVNTGALLTLLSVLVIFFGFLFFTYKLKKTIAHFSTLFILFFLIGCSSYLLPIVRSQAEAPFSNSVKTASELLFYIQAKQFGVSKIPLVKGTSFNAPLDVRKPFVDGVPQYGYDSKTKKYIITSDYRYEVPNYDDRFSMFFPRVFHKNNANQEAYKTWTTIKGTPISTTIQGKEKTIAKPTFVENITFFYNYQVNWLYLRYLYHNFIGKQNDLKATGAIKKGNWKSGFNFVDRSRIGDQQYIPEYYKNKNSNDSFYFLPFLLGLWGLFLLRKNKLYFYTSILLFLTFGIGITLYVNPVPQSLMIRERDYIFTASFIFFSVWIGLGVIGVFKSLRFIKNKSIQLFITGFITVIISPFQLFAKGIDNQNRTHDNFAHQLAKTYLDSCPEQAILFTNADNVSFPLWYLQEVENYRTDVRVINYDQLVLDWFVERLSLKMNKSLPIRISLSNNFVKKPLNTEIPYHKITNQYLNVKQLSNFLNNPDNRISYLEKKLMFFPTENLILPVDSTSVFKNEINGINRELIQIDSLKWTFKKPTYLKRDIVVLDIIAHNMEQRPICFTEMGTNNHTLGLEDYMVQKGIINQLLPVQTIQGKNPKIVNTKQTYKDLIKNSNFNLLDDIGTKVTDEATTFSKIVLRRNYYFLAQALMEENKFEKAIEVLHFTEKLFPNHSVPYGEYAFALGKLYFRLNNLEKGNEICSTAIENVENEIRWMISFNPPNPIINVRHANYLFKIYSQMIQQIKPYNNSYFNEKVTTGTAIEKRLNQWKKKNWPY